MTSRENERPAYRELILVASELFKGAPEIRQSIRWVLRTPEALVSRVSSFNEINGALDHLMADKWVLPEGLRDVRILQKGLGGLSLPELERARADYYSDEKIQGIIQDLLNRAKKEHPSWAVVNSDYPSPATPAVGSFLEGYASYLQSLRPDASNLARYYVLAFEEVLIRDFASSPLLLDVIGWMAEGISSFPEETQKRIQTISDGWQREKRQGEASKIEK